MFFLGNYIFFIGKFIIRYFWNKIKCVFKEFWMIFDKSVKILNVWFFVLLLIKLSKNFRLWCLDEYLCLIVFLICVFLFFVNFWLCKILLWILNCVLWCWDKMKFENKKKCV